jgi:hypothetical protein
VLIQLSSTVSPDGPFLPNSLSQHSSASYTPNTSNTTLLQLVIITRRTAALITDDTAVNIVIWDNAFIVAKVYPSVLRSVRHLGMRGFFVAEVYCGVEIC